ncbi:hypothetical protein AgCh_022027 [Apium graveolens]
MDFSFVPTSSSRPVNAFILQVEQRRTKALDDRPGKGQLIRSYPGISSILRSALLISYSLCLELSAVHHSELSKAAKRSISLTQPYQIRRELVDLQLLEAFLYRAAMAIHLSLRVAPLDLQQGGNSRIPYPKLRTRPCLRRTRATHQRKSTSAKPYTREIKLLLVVPDPRKESFLVWLGSFRMIVYRGYYSYRKKGNRAKLDESDGQSQPPPIR